MLFEETDALKKNPQPRVLDALSVVELTDYIAELEMEIARVREEIARKESHAQTAAAFFKQS